MYHIFKRKYKDHAGHEAAAWYYWFYDFTGKRIQKVCKDCKTKTDALRYVSQLPPQNKSSAKISDIANSMFIKGSEHLRRRLALGKQISDETIINNRRFIKKIITLWGGEDITNFDTTKVLRFLIGEEKSPGYKNCFIAAVEEIYDEAFWQGVKCVKPKIPRFRKRRGHKDIFSADELKLFFQVQNFNGYGADAETLYLFFLSLYLGGLRLSEGRGLRPMQFIFEQSALIVDGFCKYDGARTTFNKAGSVENPKTRIVLMPADFLKKIKSYIEKENRSPQDFLFQYRAAPLTKDYAEKIFEKVLKKVGLKTPTRQLTPHSLRFTYVTQLRAGVSGDVVQKLVGHSSAYMTDYYTKMTLDTGIKGIEASREAIENLLNF